MVELIITASDELYAQLSERARANGSIPQRARNVLQGFEQASRLSQVHAGCTASGKTSADTHAQKGLSRVVVDMSLRAADTLLETLHSRQSTSHIPLTAVKCDGQALPVALRRLCTGILEIGDDSPPHTQERGRP